MWLVFWGFFVGQIYIKDMVKIQEVGLKILLFIRPTKSVGIKLGNPHFV